MAKKKSELDTGLINEMQKRNKIMIQSMHKISINKLSELLFFFFYYFYWNTCETQKMFARSFNYCGFIHNILLLFFFFCVCVILKAFNYGGTVRLDWNALYFYCVACLGTLNLFAGIFIVELLTSLMRWFSVASGFFF